MKQTSTFGRVAVTSVGRAERTSKQIRDVTKTRNQSYNGLRAYVNENRLVDGELTDYERKMRASRYDRVGKSKLLISTNV